MAWKSQQSQTCLEFRYWSECAWSAGSRSQRGESLEIVEPVQMLDNKHGRKNLRWRVTEIMRVVVLERAAINQIVKDLRKVGEGPRHLCMTSQNHQPIRCFCFSFFRKKTNTPSTPSGQTLPCRRSTWKWMVPLNPLETGTSLNRMYPWARASGLARRGPVFPSDWKLLCRHSCAPAQSGWSRWRKLKVSGHFAEKGRSNLPEAVTKNKNTNSLPPTQLYVSVKGKESFSVESVSSGSIHTLVEEGKDTFTDPSWWTYRDSTREKSCVS